MKEIKEFMNLDINGKEFIKQLSKQHRCSQAVTKSFLEDFFDVILRNMKDGNSVSFYGFGKFDVVKKNECQIPDNTNGGMMTIPPRFVPRFVPGQRVLLAAKEYEVYGGSGVDA